MKKMLLLAAAILFILTTNINAQDIFHSIQGKWFDQESIMEFHKDGKLIITNRQTSQKVEGKYLLFPPNEMLMKLHGAPFDSHFIVSISGNELTLRGFQGSFKMKRTPGVQ